ncbi:MAG TPA: hypothetical protein VEF53_08395 [Patescibacteria group bacterium]|nr:hypothetical protein [Patescibacteria group bacterium]
MPVSKYTINNYTKEYGSIMQFNKNKDTYIHGWYPFVEGYSKDFIRSIINEYSKRFSRLPTSCLEPFSGSGTTPLELQKLGIGCTSFEVSPFMYNLSLAKLDTKYTVNTFKKYYSEIATSLDNYHMDIERYISPPNTKTIVEKPGLDKWNFNHEIMKGILDIKYAINLIKSSRYKSLFKIALASILLDVSNVYRNGKCISYKKDWKSTVKYSRTDVHSIYLQKLEQVFLPDIIKLEQYKRNNGTLFSNYEKCTWGDVRKKLPVTTKDSSIDLIITSPPYLNSRDYTDTYMVELKMLDYIKNYDELRKLRSKTLRSHVQVKWEDVKLLNVESLRNSVSEIAEHKDEFWNDSLLNMIKGYFEDFDILFQNLNRKLNQNGIIYFNVANSAYFGVEIKTDEIVAEIAENNGFVVEEIREARQIKPSSQQKETIDSLRESVIVITKKGK